MSTRFSRTAELLGDDVLKRLGAAKVVIVGLGGVGGAAAEVLIRSGIGGFRFVDGDRIEKSNLNRQILATEPVINMYKTQIAVERCGSINPDAEATVVNEFVTCDNVKTIVDASFDYCIDAIDDVNAKVELVALCKALNVPIISAMGAGNRVECDFCVTDIYKTAYDPLARKMRKLLRYRGIAELDVVCAATPPNVTRAKPASIAAPPFVMGALMANFAIKRILGL